MSKFFMKTSRIQMNSPCIHHRMKLLQCRQEKMLKTQAWEQGTFGVGFHQKLFALGFSFCYQLNKNVGVFSAILQT